MKHNRSMFIEEFISQFDIDHIKDRSEHAYFEGEEANNRVVKYLSDRVGNIKKMLGLLINEHGLYEVKKTFMALEWAIEQEKLDKIKFDSEHNIDEDMDQDFQGKIDDWIGEQPNLED
jgi:hypothetical protein